MTRRKPVSEAIACRDYIVGYGVPVHVDQDKVVFDHGSIIRFPDPTRLVTVYTVTSM